MTADIGTWAGAFGAGVALGGAYLFLLWLSVRALASRSWSVPYQVAVFLLPTVLRLGLVFGAFYIAIVLDATIGAIAVASLGFVAARTTITSIVRQHGEGAS